MVGARVACMRLDSLSDLAAVLLSVPVEPQAMQAAQEAALDEADPPWVLLAHHGVRVRLHNTRKGSKWQWKSEHAASARA